MNRSARWVLAVVAVQVALIGIYWLVERDRSRDARVGSALGTDPPRQMDATFPALTLRRSDGRTVRLPAPNRPRLVHFWATWCPPCRAELPGLLQLGREHPVDVVAVALDEDWTKVHSFLRGRSAADVFLGNRREIEHRLGVRTLPVTFLVRPDGRSVYRFDGARDWTDSRYVRSWVRP